VPALRRSPWGWKSGEGLNIILVALAALYLAFTVVYIQSSGLFDYIGADFRVFRASAEIAVTQGFGQVYDIAPQGAQDTVQSRLYQEYATGPERANYAVIPLPYLPAYVLLFLPLLLLDPLSGFIIWTILNAAGLVLYLWRFRRALPAYQGRDLTLLLLLSYPAFLNLFFGQVNLLLLICLGEFYLALVRGREFASGLWLAGLLLKPQVLFLLLPGLLLRGRWRALAGCAAASLPILGLSLLLGGVQGMWDWAQLVLLYPGGVATNVPELMMNWRALAFNLEALLPTAAAWGIGWAGLGLTALAALSLWLRRVEPSSPRFAVVLLGTYAATCAVAWHAHVHMALPLLAVFLALEASRQLPRPALNAWAILPALVFFVTILVVPRIAPGLAGPGLLAVPGLTMLALNLFLLGWAVRTLWRREPAAAGPSGQASAA
jgi:hypothetical protein